MKKEHNYVTCNWCANWDVNWNESLVLRTERTCPYCKNTGKVIDPRELLCNFCGETMCPIGSMNEQIPHGLHKAKVTGGYDSYHLMDLSSYVFSFCEKCLRTLFIQCKIKPDVYDAEFPEKFGDFDYKIGKEQKWEDDQKNWEYREWQTHGGFHQAFLNKKCNTIKDCPNNAKYTVLYSEESLFSEETCCEACKAQRSWAVNARFVPFISDTLKVFV